MKVTGYMDAAFAMRMEMTKAERWPVQYSQFTGSAWLRGGGGNFQGVIFTGYFSFILSFLNSALVPLRGSE